MAALKANEDTKVLGNADNGFVPQDTDVDPAAYKLQQEQEPSITKTEVGISDPADTGTAVQPKTELPYTSLTKPDVADNKSENVFGYSEGMYGTSEYGEYGTGKVSRPTLVFKHQGLGLELEFTGEIPLDPTKLEGYLTYGFNAISEKYFGRPASKSPDQGNKISQLIEDIEAGYYAECPIDLAPFLDETVPYRSPTETLGIGPKSVDVGNLKREALTIGAGARAAGMSLDPNVRPAASRGNSQNNEIIPMAEVVSGFNNLTAPEIPYVNPHLPQGSTPLGYESLPVAVPVLGGDDNNNVPQLQYATVADNDSLTMAVPVLGGGDDNGPKRQDVYAAGNEEQTFGDTLLEKAKAMGDVAVSAGLRPGSSDGVTCNGVTAPRAAAHQVAIS
jgi:hypothetical protein